MKAFNILIAVILIISAAVFAGANVFVLQTEEPGGREYRVQIERSAAEVEENGFEKLDLSKYPALIAVVPCGGADNTELIQGGEADYVLREIGGELYRFDYETVDSAYKTRLIAGMNISLGVMAAVMLGVLLFVRLRLLKPFHSLRELPYELSKGNLTVPLKENKSRYFGRFIWGMDLLRERLEQQKTEELRLQKEKKTLILSVAHDIKTPLSAIKLYAKALSKNLYEDRARQIEIAENINARADDVERFLTEIVKASNEDFLNLPTKDGEFYLSALIKTIAEYYKDKLGYLKIGFEIGPYTDCILNGDEERAVEVLQNIIENAVKYGAGSAVRLSFSDEEDCRLISVSNSGCTLSENEAPHIFDSFWRGANAQGISGSGLGLYICRQLMHKMDGEIFACNKGDEMTVTAVFRKA